MLKLSPKTVEDHRASIMSKTESSGLAQLSPATRGAKGSGGRAACNGVDLDAVRAHQLLGEAVQS
jgi:hypothetical protein